MMRKDFFLNDIFNQRRPFILTSGLIILLILVMEIVNNRFSMSDFQVYYYAARAFMSDQSLYSHPFGDEATGFYKYSPFALFFFIPLSLFPLVVAKVIYFLSVGVAGIAVLLISAHLLRDVPMNQKVFNNGMLAVVAVVAGARLHRELHLGNVNLILLMILMMVLWFALERRQVMAGILFAVVLFIKPHFIILAPLFLIRRQFTILAVAVAGMIIEITVPALFAGFDGTRELHVNWVQAMMQHNGSMEGVYNTIYSLFFLVPKYLPGLDFGIPDKVVVIVLLMVVVVVFGWFCIGNIRREREQGSRFPVSFRIEFLILIALIPNLMNTDSEHFLLSIPILFFLLGLMRREVPLWFKISVGLAMLVYGMNIHDLIGHRLSMWLGDNGALGMSNLVLILLSGYGYRRFVFPAGEASVRPDLYPEKQTVLRKTFESGK